MSNYAAQQASSPAIVRRRRYHAVLCFCRPRAAGSARLAPPSANRAPEHGLSRKGRRRREQGAECTLASNDHTAATPDLSNAMAVDSVGLPPIAAAAAAGQAPRPTSHSTLDVSCAATLTDAQESIGGGPSRALGDVIAEKKAGEPVVVSFDALGLAHLNPRVRPFSPPFSALGPHADGRRILPSELVARPSVGPSYGSGSFR